METHAWVDGRGDERKEEDETQKWAAAGKLSFLRAILPETHCGRSKDGTHGYKSVWRHAGEKAVTTPQRAMINSCTLKIAHIIMHSSPQELPLCKCAALIKAEWEQLGLHINRFDLFIIMVCQPNTPPVRRYIQTLLTSFVGLLGLWWEGLPKVSTSQAWDDVCTGFGCSAVK